MPQSDDAYCLARYEALRHSQSDLFDNPPGCPITILLDPAEIRRAQDEARAERSAKSMPVSDLRAGVLAEDPYIGLVVRDAVRFSDGRRGLYNRVVASGGIVVLPIVDHGIALIRIFRHAPRRWMLEAPQGLLLPDADPAEQARLELMEEMGATAADIIPLGRIFTSTALTSETLQVFAARVTATGAPQLSEGIESIRVIPTSDINACMLDGTICDGPTIAAITHARLRGLL